MKRRPSKLLHVGRVPVGGGSPVSVQSMTNTRTSDADATLAQIRELADLGCDIIRCAVPAKAAILSIMCLFIVPLLLAGYPRYYGFSSGLMF